MNPMHMMKRSLALGALFAAALVGACGGGAEEIVVEEVDTVVELDIPGVNPAALSEYYDGVRALNETPTNYVEALSRFEAAFAADPDFWEALENVGLIQMDLGRHADAARTFQQELDLIDDLVSREWPVEPRPAVYLNLGKALALAGRTNEAAQAFGELLQIDPDNVEARANLAVLNLQMRNFDGADTYIRELLEMSRNDAGALGVLALVLKEQGDMQQAEYVWQKALGEIGATMTTLTGQNCVLTESTWDEERCADAELVWTDDAGAEVTASAADRATWPPELRDFDDEDIERRVRYNAGRLDRMLKARSDIANELGILAWADGDQDRAEALFQAAVADNPRNAAAHINAAAVYLDYAFFDQACFHFGEALSLRPTDEMGMIGYASCTYGQGDVEGGLQAFQAAFAEHSTNDYISQRIAEIAFTDLNDLDTAEQFYLRTLELNGLSLDNCDVREDTGCGEVQSIRQIREMQQQQEQMQQQ